MTLAFDTCDDVITLFDSASTPFRDSCQGDERFNELCLVVNRVSRNTHKLAMSVLLCNFEWK